MKWLNKLKCILAKILKKKNIDSEPTSDRESSEDSYEFRVKEEGGSALPNVNERKNREIDLPIKMNVLVVNGNKPLEKIVRHRVKEETNKTVVFDTVSTLEIERPLTPLPKYNEDGNYEKFENHYRYYLTKGTNYERKIVIQKVKKAVNENKVHHCEWVKPLLELSSYNDNGTRQYAFLALLSFPLDSLIKDLVYKHFENDSFDMIKNRVEKERDTLVRTLYLRKTESRYEQKSEPKNINIRELKLDNSVPQKILDKQVRSIDSVKKLDTTVEKNVLQKNIHLSKSKEQINRLFPDKGYTKPKPSSIYKPIGDTQKLNSSKSEPTYSVQLEIQDMLELNNNLTTVSIEQLPKNHSIAPHHIFDNEIQQECKARNIKSIYHFTNARNIPKIISNGILSVKQLKEKSIEYEFNDKNRFDNMLNASCWSISFTNTMYFHNAREREPDMKWCVIECEASPLWELPCYFFEKNAASNQMKRVHYSQRLGVNALKKMFERTDLNVLPSYYPTDIQAEVLIVEPVSSTKIKSIYTDSRLVYEYYTERYPKIFKFDDKLFKYRN